MINLLTPEKKEATQLKRELSINTNPATIVNLLTPEKKRSPGAILQSESDSESELEGDVTEVDAMKDIGYVTLPSYLDYASMS